MDFRWLRCSRCTVCTLRGQIGNPEGEEKPNKKYYDPRACIRSAEESTVKRPLDFLFGENVYCSIPLKLNMAEKEMNRTWKLVIVGGWLVTTFWEVQVFFCKVNDVLNAMWAAKKIHLFNPVHICWIVVVGIWWRPKHNSELCIRLQQCISFLLRKPSATVV